MSGIYIPMEMPKRGHTVTLTILGGGEVCVQYYDCKPHLTVPIVYKAIPVPDHGRLIDGDALYEKFLRLESEAMSALQTTSVGSVDGIKWSAILTERTGYKFDIVDAPTVIPAEEGQ